MKRIAAPAFVLLAVACASAPPPAKEEDPQVRVDRLFPKPENLESGKISVNIEKYNPRASSMSVSGIDYTVPPEGLEPVSGSVKGGATLEAEQEARRYEARRAQQQQQSSPSRVSYAV